MEIKDALGFDTVIPLAMWHDKSIDPAAIKLYAFIRNLSNQEGYCYASNKYLCELMDYKETQLRKFLKDLKLAGYLDIKTDKNGIQWQRRLYISDRFKIRLRRSVDRGGGIATARGGHRYSEGIIKSKSNEEKDTPYNPPEGEVAFGSFVRLRTEDYDNLCKDHGKEIIDDLIDDMNNWVPNNKPFKDYLAALRNWLKRRKNGSNSSLNRPKEGSRHVESNKALAKKIEQNFRHLILKGEIRINLHDIEFVSGNHCLVIKYEDHGFKDQVLNRLMKMGWDITDLL